MTFEDYNRLLDATDKAREYADNESVDMIYATLEQTQLALEDYCTKNIPNFGRVGKVSVKTTVENGILENNIDILMNGKIMSEADFEPYSQEIADIMQEINEKMGWNNEK